MAWMEYSGVAADASVAQMARSAAVMVAVQCLFIWIMLPHV